MVRASACHAEGRGSEPRHSRQLKKPLEIQRFFCFKICWLGAATFLLFSFRFISGCFARNKDNLMTKDEEKMKKYEILLLVIALGWGVFHYAFDTKPAAAPEVKTTVSVLKAAPRKIQYAYNTVGTVVPLQEAVIRPQISGKLTEILFNEGETVAKGTVIAKIDDASVAAELDRAKAVLSSDKAKLHESETNLKRYRQLRKESVVSQKQLEEIESLFEQSRAAVMSSEAEVEKAAVSYKHATITAPVSGRIGLKNVTEGNIVSAADGTEIATITQIAPISVVFALPQQLFGALAQTGEAFVEVFDNASKNKLDTGKITAFDNAIDKQNGTIRARADFENHSEKLWPGQSVAVRFVYGLNRDKIVLPQKLIRPGLDKSYVYKYMNGAAKIVPIDTGYTNDVETVVISGVEDGDMIIADNFSKLTDGTPVEVAPQGLEK